MVELRGMTMKMICLIAKLLTSECSHPECLNVVWELFLMCEDEILNNEFFEVDESNVVKIKK